MKENYIAVELDLHRSEFGKYLLAHYDILEEIYHSENSQIFKIKQLGSNNIRVLKAIKKRPFINFDLDGFQKIRHEHIVLVDQTGESEHFYYMLMEFIDGTTLETAVETFGPYSTELVQKYIHQIYQALQYLHHHYDGQLIYRDLKPSNIMVTKDGKITLIDINTLRMKKDLSKSDTYYIGSRGYTAPEAYGYAQSTETSDVYSLGATLYFLLTGQIPSVGNLFHEEIKASNLNQKYKAIILKATKFNPKDRYQSVGAFKQAISKPNAMKKIIVLASCLVILTMATGFGLNIYNSLGIKPSGGYESDKTSPQKNTDLFETQTSQSASEGDVLVLEHTEVTTEPSLEPSTESKTEPVSQPMTEQKTETKTEPKTEPKTELVIKSTEATTEEAKPTILTPQETTESVNQGIPFTQEDVGNMKQAGSGLTILKQAGFINVTYDRTVMESSLNDFKYMCVVRSDSPFDKSRLYNLAYEAAVLKRGFHTYTEEGYNEVIIAGDYFAITIYDAMKKPIGYYFFNEPYTP